MKASVLGFGTVGVGVYEMLCASKSLEAGTVLVREGKNNTPYKVTNIDEIVNSPDITAVAEVMGGIDPAYGFLRKAIEAGKHAVTSNKALVAEKGIELAQLARENGVSFLFSAACGGAVPFLHNLALAAESDTIISVGGILNGTTNFMLDKMQRCGDDYSAALKEAQRLGYAEADPTADVSGLDALRKLMLACAVAFDILPTEGFEREGIENITAEDVKHFQSLDLTCRLLVSGGKADGKLYANVQPTLFPRSAPECSVLENFNMAKYYGVNSGSIVLIGQGAGRYPTASAVVRDLNSVGSGHEMLTSDCVRGAANNSIVKMSYYERLPKEYAEEFDSARSWLDGEYIRMVTSPISVSEMHAKVKFLREKGAKIFFAAIGE